MIAYLFTTIVEITVSTSIVIVILLLLSPLLNKNYTAKWQYWVWLVLAFRLILPFNFSLSQSPIQITLPIQNITYKVPIQIAPVPVIKTDMVAPIATVSWKEILSFHEIIAIIWFTGMCLFLFYQISCYIIFKKSVKRWSKTVTNQQIVKQFEQLLQQLGITKKIELKTCKKLGSPMLVGFIRPIVWLPTEQYRDEELQVIFKHELIHYKRHDLWYKLVMLCANAVHWFNPIVYFMIGEANKNIEIWCDNEVVKNTDMAFRKQYSEIILSMIHIHQLKKTMFSTHFNGGKKVMKRRFISIFDRGKKRKGIIALCALLALTIFSGLLFACSANPASTKDSNDTLSLAKQNSSQSSNDIFAVKDTNETSQGESIIDMIKEEATDVTSQGKLTDKTNKETTDQISKETSDGIYPDKDAFLNSTEGHDFQVTSWKFTKAYLSGDESAMKSYLIDTENKNIQHLTGSIFNDVEFLILKLSLEDVKEDSVIAEYEFAQKGEESYSYVFLSMKKVDNEWKVESYGLEK